VGLSGIGPGGEEGFGVMAETEWEPSLVREESWPVRVAGSVE
jgi:hypothetical protein